jgi:hypothetical protein
MEKSAYFNLQKTQSSGVDSVLLVGNRACGRKIAGRELEEQFAVSLKSGPAYVLFVTDGVPFEEGLHIYLLDPNGRLLDQRHFSDIYAPGVLKDVRVASEREVRFDFRGAHRLTIAEAPKGLRRRYLEIKEDVGDS